MTETSKFDLRALIAEVKDTDTRPLFRHDYCVDRRLLDDLAELEVERDKAQAELDRKKPDPDQPAKKARYGTPSEVQELSAQVKDVIERLDAHMDKVHARQVRYVGRGLSSEDYNALLIEHDGKTTHALKVALIRAAFTHFEHDGQKVAGGVDELDALLAKMNAGEITTLSNKAFGATNESVDMDLPFSGKRSQPPRS